MAYTDWQSIKGVCITWDDNPGMYLWTLQWLDAENNQVGSAEYDVHKAKLLDVVRAHEEALGPLDNKYIGTKRNPPVVPEPARDPRDMSA